MFDRDTPFNDLPPLPPASEVETAAVLKKAIAASRAPAELKGMAERDFNLRRTPGTRIANSRGETIYTPPEGEAVIRDKLRDLENYMHATTAWTCWPAIF